MSGESKGSGRARVSMGGWAAGRLSNHEPDGSFFDRPVLSERLILRQAQDERRVEGLRTSEGVDWTFARVELFEPRARPLVLRQACPERAAHPSTGSGCAASRWAQDERVCR